MYYYLRKNRNKNIIFIFVFPSSCKKHVVHVGEKSSPHFAPIRMNVTSKINEVLGEHPKGMA